MSNKDRVSRIAKLDPQISTLISAEEQRQQEKIILIPSESLTPPAVLEALGSVFNSVYAEGYPRAAMRKSSPSSLAKLDQQLASHRRYADWRFYKGTEFADLVESLAGRRAAECFATPDYPAERIYANVQPLSGAAANLAVYEAFVDPGDTMMGMALTEGGHLTHGSEFNITGKRYQIVSYSADPQTGKLDYSQIMQLAKSHRPRLIIGGFTSYPWQADWSEFRKIADEVGAILLADIAHTAGMVTAGVYPNPIGYADVVTLTTHKTLCGPRGAVILSTDPKIAALVDTAIFPGEQGGPHVNKFAAIAVALAIAQSPEFKDLQGQIVKNAGYLAEALQKEGLTLAYGGTNTHLLLVDLRTLTNDTGFVMMGEIASRILDLVGIVCNKNTIPGDHSAADAHGIRLGTPWATQRGMGKEEMETLAQIITKVLTSIRPFSYLGLNGKLSRGKLPLSVLEQATQDVRAIIAHIDPEAKSIEKTHLQPENPDSIAFLRVRSGRATALLNEAVTSDLLTLDKDQQQRSLMFNSEGQLISEILVGRLAEEDYLLLIPVPVKEKIKSWLVGLANGYILFDRKDIFRKVQGPAIVEEVMRATIPASAKEWLLTNPPTKWGSLTIQEMYCQQPELFAIHKPYFVGQGLLELSEQTDNRVSFSWKEKEEALKHTPIYDEHKGLGAKLVPFAGWEMPVWYTSTLEEHRAVRKTAGLFDLGHMGVFEVSGEYATEFLNVVTSNYAAWLDNGESQYAYLLTPSGEVIDDIFVYRRAHDRYLLVVNAVNENKDWKWLTGVNAQRYLIDQELPSRHSGPEVNLCNLREERGVMDLALQGPLSQKILEQVTDKAERLAISCLQRTEFCEVFIDGHQLLVARTGYTGEEIGYEIYLARADALWLWHKLLEVGTPLGMKPCGLSARDSTRTEAGLPLYGHELAGPYQINPFEAGFGAYVKLHKPFFIGRNHCLKAYTNPTRETVRFQVDMTGARPIHPGAAVIDRNGHYLGRVTSCVSLCDSQVGLALVNKLGICPETKITVLNPPHKNEAAKASLDLAQGDRVALPTSGRIIPRFPEKEISN